MILPAVIFLGIIGVGCKKIIEIDPPRSSSTSEVIFSTNTQANNVLAGLYITFSSSSSIYAGLSADEIVRSNGVANPTEYQFMTNNLLTDNAVPMTALWSPMYKTIYNANSIIEGVEKSTSPQLTDDVRKLLTGEAKFVRAFSYFYLTNFFGDLPLVLTIDFNKTVKLARSPQVEIYKQMEEDLLAAQSLLPSDYSLTKEERIRPNRWAATALLSRVYLYQKKWAEAEAQATSIIANTAQYSLVTPLTGVFLRKSREAILQLETKTAKTPFGIQDQVSFSGTLSWNNQTAADKANYLIPSNWAIYGPFFRPIFTLSDQLASSFETNDRRNQLWVSSIPSPAAAPYNGIVVYYPYKYTQPLVQNSTPTQNLTVLRFAEQYLIRAEARAEQNNIAGAKSDINMIRSRAGLPETAASTRAELIVAVAQERKVELFTEWGHRFFDLKRTNKAEDVLGAIPIKQPFKSFQLLYPIPVQEIISDPNLIQNPGY